MIYSNQAEKKWDYSREIQKAEEFTRDDPMKRVKRPNKTFENSTTGKTNI